MLYIHDKTKAIFDLTSSGQNKLLKAKVLAITAVETDEKASTYFLDSRGKIPAHFVLDGTDIIKFDYNTTNVFPINTKWTYKAKHSSAGWEGRSHSEASPTRPRAPP